MTLIVAVGNPNYVAVVSDRRLTGRADDESKCLFIGVFGFFVAKDETVPRLTRVFISNCSEGVRGRFASKIEQATRPDDPAASFALIGGAHQPAYEPRRREIEELARQGRPAKAIVAKAIELIRMAATTDRKVGPQCSSVVVTREGTGSFNYHSGVPTKRIYTPAIVTPTDTFLGAYLERMSPGFATVPKVASGEPCPCRSGRRYGRCHGRPPARGVQPKVVFTPDGKIEINVGAHRLPSDRHEVVFDIAEDELQPTRPRKRRG